MKKARKLLVALLVLTFLLGTFNVGFVAAAEEDLPSHVTRALALGYLKGFEDGELKLDQQVTRAQALAFIIRISGLEASAELMKGQTQFADVNNDPSLQWATGYINLGVGQGIINGYPDGTFKGNNNVTYAEMAKMLLYAMNYGVTVEGGVWPAAVMGKADDLKLFDKVNAVPNVPALRGDVVKMIDNSLTIKHLVQKGYGDLAYYDEGTDTFLSKMKVDEIDGRITSVDVKKNRVTITPDEDEEDITRPTTYEVIDDSVDVDGLLGVEVTVWANDDDEVFFVDPDMDAVKVDVIDEDVAKDADEVALRIADDEFDVASNVKVYING
ncbi:MAG: S-layer homology domain-containing protein, partial [Tepidanaerobacteraceae bacterium]